MKLRRNVFYNLAGFGLPAIILFVSYPPLLKALGNEQFGLVALATSLSAALSFLDFGLSSATVKFIVGDLERGHRQNAAKVVTTSLAFFGALGIFISLAMFALSPLLAGWLHVEASQQQLAVRVFRITALQISFSLVLSTVAGIFKAFDRFDLAAIVVTGVALTANALPSYLVAEHGQSLTTALEIVIVCLAALTLAVLAAVRQVCVAKSLDLLQARPDTKTLKRTMGFGLYLTVHGIIGMLFSQGQRVLIGFLFGPASLASFQLSLTLVSKVHAAINAAAEVALPIASGAQRKLIRPLYFRAMCVLTLMSAIPLLLLAIGSESILHFWLGKNVPPLAAELLPPLCLAYFFVAVAALPFHIINGLGRPEVNVVLGICNLLIYAVCLFYFELSDTRSAIHIAVAYAISNCLCGIVYQIYCLRSLRRVEFAENNGTRIHAEQH